MKAEVVFFDIGHTLVTGAEQSPKKLLAARLQLSEEETEAVGRVIMTHPSREPALLSTVLGEILPRLESGQLRSAVEAVWEEQIHCVREIPGATALLQFLKEAGFRLGVISNIWHPFYEGFCRTCAEMPALLDYGILSYQVGHKKPSGHIYRSALREAGAAASSCWMVGDTYELDMAPAAQLGMRTIWMLNRPERETKQLVRILRGEAPSPQWTVENLEEVLEFFQNGRHHEKDVIANV